MLEQWNRHIWKACYCHVIQSPVWETFCIKTQTLRTMEIQNGHHCDYRYFERCRLNLMAPLKKFNFTEIFNCNELMWSLHWIFCGMNFSWTSWTALLWCCCSGDMNSEQSVGLNNKMQIITKCFVYLQVFVCCLEFNIPSQILCFLIVLDLELGEMPSCAGTLLVCYEWHNSPLIWKFIVRNRKLLCFWSVCYAVV